MPKMTSAAVVTNGACSPCGSATLFSAITTKHPPITPNTAPRMASRPSSITTCAIELCPIEISSTSVSVKNTANGSLLPDSASRVAPTRGRSRKPCACTSRNTAAASVEATTAPTSNASVQLRSKAYYATGAVMNAVSSTPTNTNTTENTNTAQKL